MPNYNYYDRLIRTVTPEGKTTEPRRPGILDLPAMKLFSSPTIGRTGKTIHLDPDLMDTRRALQKTADRTDLDLYNKSENYRERALARARAEGMMSELGRKRKLKKSAMRKVGLGREAMAAALYEMAEELEAASPYYETEE